jgi:hypothetical protein
MIKLDKKNCDFNDRNRNYRNIILIFAAYSDFFLKKNELKN